MSPAPWRTVPKVSADLADGAPHVANAGDVAALLPLVQRVIRARVDNRAVADDLVQETLARVLAASDRVQPDMLEPYAITTARNLVASLWKERDRHRRNQHRVIDLRPPVGPDEELLQREEQDAVAAALAQLSEQERNLLLAHEVSGQDTRSLADERGSTAGAIAAQLNRTRARLRVEYLLAIEGGGEPATDRCRAVLRALSSGDRRRQREVDADHHLLECDFCARLSPPLLGRGQQRDDEIRIKVSSDGDVVLARQGARDLAARLGFSRTELTVLATAVSEITRNIVRFTDGGEVVISLIEHPRSGVRIVARDAGPGIADLDRALIDGYSTYRGLGLGLPGARRLMDEFDVESSPGKGTTVTMTKWLRRG
jgi:RNA polymerase sigma factor (sigma-70 family)